MLQLFFYGLGTLAGSFFCSLSEAALLSASEARIRTRIDLGAKGGERLLKLKKAPRRTLASIVFLNNLFAIGGTALITPSFQDVFGHGETELAIFISTWTFLVIAFGEIVPKLLGEALPEPIAERVAPALIWVQRILTPFVFVVDLVVSWARPKTRVTQGEEAEIRELARLGHEEGHIDAEEAELIRRIFRLDDITAEDVMTPRPLVQSLDADDVLADVRTEIMTSNHGQFPVYEGDLDKVVGIVEQHAALKAMIRGEAERKVRDIMKPALFLPVSKKVDDVMRVLQEAHGKLGIVIDEYGVTEGIVTMDDLVEELVGEAIDDLDVSEGLVKRLSRRTALVHGLTRVRDVARFLNCPVDFATTEEENTTVNGLLQDKLGRIPESGDKVELPPGLRFVVREADGRAALRVFAKVVVDGEDSPTAPPGDA